MKVIIEKFGQLAEDYLVVSGQTFAQIFSAILEEDAFAGTFQKFVDGQPLSEVANDVAYDGAKLTLVPKMDSGS